MDSNTLRNLAEAYYAVYDDNIRSEIDYDLTTEDLSFIDDLSDNELDQVFETLLINQEIDLDECFDTLDFVLTEARVTSSDDRPVGSARVTTSADRPSRVARTSERQRQVRVGRIAQAAQRVGEKLASPARGRSGTSVSSRVGQASQKVKSAAQKVKGFLGKVGRAAKAGAVAAKKEFSGEAGKEAQAKYREKKEKREKEAKASVGHPFASSSKSTKKPSDPWSGSATKPSPKVTTKSTKALSGSTSRAALPPAKESDKRQVAKTKLAKAAAGSTSRGIRFAGRSSTQVAPKRAHTGIKKALDRFRSKAGISEELFNSILNYIFEDLVNGGYAQSHDHALHIFESFSQDEMCEIVESYLNEEYETVNFYDVVMNYLLDEGFADNQESAEVIMVNMSEEWRTEIIEASYSAKAARAGKDIGKPGKQFAKIAKEAGKRYGSKERGEKVAGAVLAKIRAKKG